MRSEGLVGEERAALGALGVILTTFIVSLLFLLLIGTARLPITAHIAAVAGVRILGSLAIIVGALWLYEGIASEGWPTAEAVVVDKTLGWGSGNRGSTPRAAIVRYRYTVAERTYSSSRWMAGDEHFAGSTVAAQRHLEQFGAATTIRYNPIWPANAVVRPGITNVTWALFIAGPWLLFIASFLHRQLRERR
jgi:hypothetical protein